MRIFLLHIVFVFSLGCSGNLPPEPQEAKKWSVRMSDAVLSNADSLIHYLNPKQVKWQYDVSMLGQAIDKLGNIDPVYSRYMEDYINYFVKEDGTVLKYKLQDYNLDNINPAKNLITLYKRTGEEKYLLAINSFIEQLKNQPVTPSGGYWHKKRYPNQMWLDGIYMSAPFIAQYAAEFNHPEWFDSIFLQISLIYSATADTATGLLYHAWDESRKEKWCDPETGRSKQFWSRAMGWYMMALVDVLDYFPLNHPGRDSLISILEHTSEALIRVRDPEKKLWYQVLDKGNSPGNYLEGSGSSMFVYAFAKASSKGYLNEKYREIAEESYQAILDEFIVIENGIPVMKNICGGCGLGGDPYRDGSYEYYINELKVDNDPKGVGPFILASIELNK